jgi:hypothetical protein
MAEHLHTENLGAFLVRISQVNVDLAIASNVPCHPCFPWYLSRHEIAPLSLSGAAEGRYEISALALGNALQSLGLTEKIRSGDSLNHSEYEVLKLFSTLQHDACRQPGSDTSLWINFGFCYCKSFKQREQLGRMYLALVASGAAFDAIVSAYETSTLKDLMVAHGIDVSSLDKQDIKLPKPRGSEYAVFRLMVAVEHALSDRYCSCFRVSQGRKCHWYFETHLDIECDGAYGFHLTNSWERWQLLNFYKYLFSLSAFDAVKMAKATTSGELEPYLETLVPNMRKKIMDLDRASTPMYPILKNRTRSQTSEGESVSHHVDCDCRVHDMVGPPGLCFFGSIFDILEEPGLCAM